MAARLDAEIGDEVALLARLIAAPSVSGEEEAVARLVEEVARGWGLDVVRDDAAVRIEVAGQERGPTLALVSHLDVVPAGQGWTREPFVPTFVEEGGEERLYGRGSCDAKASVASMLWAARDVAAGGGPRCGRLLVILGYCEETRGTSMPRALPRCGAIDAAVVGEPTGLDLAVAQRGLLMIELLARGDQRHAAYAASDGNFTSSVLKLAADLVVLPELCLEKPHPLLGQPTLTATVLEAGVARNVTPPLAKAVLDIRTTPSWTHAEVAAALQGRLQSEVLVTSERLLPCETPAGSPLLAAAQRVRPAAQQYGSPTCSDWVFLRHLDAVKCGPGVSRRSHTPDEYIATAEVRAARRFYRELALAYLESR